MPRTKKGLIGQALFLGDAVHFIYITRVNVSIRLVLPYRWETMEKFIGWDFGKGSLRTFDINQIKRIRRLTANECHPPFYHQEINLKKGAI